MWTCLKLDVVYCTLLCGVISIFVIYTYSVLQYSYTNTYSDTIQDNRHSSLQVTKNPHSIEQDFSKSCRDLSYNLPHLANQTRLMFNMVPKCGSQGVRDVIRKVSYREHFQFRGGKYKAYKYSLLPQHHTRDTLIRILNEDMNIHTDVFQMYYKHIHFVDFSIVDARTPYYINVIRDPVEHFISIYYFQKAHPWLTIWGPVGDNRRIRRKSITYNMTVDECVESVHLQCTDDEYLYLLIPFFCGQDEICLTPSKASLEKAKSNVIKYFPVVGYVENLEQFFQLSEVIWPQFFYSSSFLYKSKPFKEHKTVQRTEPSVKSKEILAARMPYEYKFYNWIKQRFQCMYNKYVTQGNETIPIQTQHPIKSTL